MTMRELFKKVETYNEVAEIIDIPYQAKLIFCIDDGRGSSIFDCKSYSTYKEFRRYFKQEIIDEITDFVLNSNEFDLGKATELRYTDKFGDERYYAFTPEIGM